MGTLRMLDLFTDFVPTISERTLMAEIFYVNGSRTQPLT